MINKGEIIKLAREAGWDEMGADLWGAAFDGAMSIHALERFAALVAAAEREACAEECENQKVGLPSYFEIDERIQWCADAIRARSKE